LLSLPILWQFGTALGEPGRAVLGEKLGEYAAFIIVIAALFVIAGGIHIQGSLAGTPLVNTGMLGLCAVLANLLRTTGAAVLLTVIAAGQAAAAGRPWAIGTREAIIAALTLTAYGGTPEENRERNGFTFGPIIEVAVLFAAIFVTMTPVLEILNAWSQGARHVLGLSFSVSHPAEFFWTTGALSSVLDNAPTYLAFAASAAGL